MAGATQFAQLQELLDKGASLLESYKKQAPQSTSELENWLLEAADKPASLLLKEDFDGIRERVRTRTGSSGS